MIDDLFDTHVRECTALLTFEQALIEHTLSNENKAMLTDAERLAKILTEDLARGKVDRKKLAEDCGVSRQAISNWLKYGTITKPNLLIVAKHTGKPVSRYMATYPTVVKSTNLPAEEPKAATYNAEAESRRLRLLSAFAQLEGKDAEQMVIAVEAAAFRARNEILLSDEPKRVA